MTSSVFLSHNHRDKWFVRRLGSGLAARGIQVWIDEAEIRVGDSLIQKIESAIDEMDYLGVVLSPNSVDSEWVHREVSIALTSEIGSRRVKVLPILLADCNLPRFLRDKLYADFRDESHFEDALENLLRSLQRDSQPGSNFYLSETDTPSVFPYSNDQSLENILKDLTSGKDEEKLAVILTCTFGSIYWQLNHILHWLFGLTFSQVRNDTELSTKQFGEAEFDVYMGLAQFLLLTGCTLPLFAIFRRRTNTLLIIVVLIPLLINIILGVWRNRFSGSSIGFTIMQSVVISVLLLAGSIRRELISSLESNEEKSYNTVMYKLDDLIER